MRASLQALCDAFIANRDIIKQHFKMENSALYPVCANIFCARHIMADGEAVKRCRNIIKQKTGIFSSFRGSLTLPIACLLAAGSDPEEKMTRALEGYAILKERFFSSESLALSAFLLADRQADMACVAQRGRELYQRMKKEHPFLTSSEDSVFALLLALSDKSDDELMTDMRRQTRYEVRRSAKLGIKVGYETTEKAFNDFYDLQLQTAERQGFIPSSRKCVLAQREVYGDMARIYTAELDGKKLCQGLVIYSAPEAIYHEAASTPDGRKFPGAYALQWQIIQDAKKLGMKRYNLFGIAPPNSPNHRFAGVTTFKTGFGGEQIAYLPAQDIVVNKLRYKLVSAIEKARKKKRHL